MDKSESLASLKMIIEAEGVDYQKSSAFQGVLFEKMDSNFAEQMHRQSMHPYSQYLIKEDNKLIWTVNTTSNQAYENIIEKLKDNDFSGFTLRHGNIDVKILEKHEKKKSYEELLKDFYDKKCDRKINVEILTLCSFKQKGKYIVVPDLRLVFQSLMMKYSIISSNDNMIDEETLEEIVDCSLITKYRLKTALFPLEGQHIPGYMGNLTITFTGTETLARYARLLLQFGEYSGIGVKTGMGMGAIRIGG